MIIAICGKSGSGKSTLANEFINKYKDKSIHCDIDKIGHQILEYEEVIARLINCFGKSIITNNKVDRKKLSELVFISSEEMDKLSDITWKYMQLEIDKLLQSNQNKIIILDWMLLPKTKYFKKCDIKILLDIPYTIRKERAIKRDNITEDKFKLRDSASIVYNENDFDYIIQENDSKTVKRLVKSL